MLATGQPAQLGHRFADDVAEGEVVLAVDPAFEGDAEDGGGDRLQGSQRGSAPCPAHTPRGGKLVITTA